MRTEAQRSVGDALAGVDGAIEALLEPGADNGEACRDALEYAVEAMNAIAGADDMRNAGPELRGEIEHLRARLNLAGRLLANAAEFYSGWAKLAGVDNPGYARDGTAPSAASVPGALTLDG